MNIWLRNILRFVLLVLIQVLIVNNMQFLGVCTPFIYVLFLIALPVTIPRWVELLLGFATGFCIDLFCNSLGIHIAACTLLSYLRPLLIRSMVQDNDRLTSSLTSRTVDMIIYIKIILILCLSHHTLLFCLLSFSFVNWWLTLLQIICSTIVTFLLVLGMDILEIDD